MVRVRAYLFDHAREAHKNSFGFCAMGIVFIRAVRVSTCIVKTEGVHRLHSIPLAVKNAETCLRSRRDSGEARDPLMMSLLIESPST